MNILLVSLSVVTISLSFPAGAAAAISGAPIYHLQTKAGSEPADETFIMTSGASFSMSISNNIIPLGVIRTSANQSSSSSIYPPPNEPEGVGDSLYFDSGGQAQTQVVLNGSGKATSSSGIDFTLSEALPFSLATSLGTNYSLGSSTAVAILGQYTPAGFVFLHFFGVGDLSGYGSSQPEAPSGAISGTLDPGRYGLRTGGFNQIGAFLGAGTATASFSTQLEVGIVPEPSSALLCAIGIFSVCIRRIRK